MTSNNPKKIVGSGSTPHKKHVGQGGCPAMTDGRRCGETKNLQIIQEFKRLYESKMRQIDDAAGGDCFQAKITLQQEWIKDLTDQNEMLVKVVEELEVEAAERVTMLEEKLQHSAKCACEKMEHVQNDLNNLIELLKRVKYHGLWNCKGLSFHTIDIEDLTEEQCDELIEDDTHDIIDCKCDSNADTSSTCKHEKLAKEKDKQVKELQEKIKKLDEEARRSCQQYAELKKSMLDMRDALTAEVAEKHDMILCLRRDMLLLEEQCKKADQQTHFKDDIIKELRREIKQLKLQKTDDEKEELLKKLRNLEADNEMMKQAIVKANKNLEKLEGKAEAYLDERDVIKRKHRESLEMIETLEKENRRSKDSLQTLEEECKASKGKVVKELEDYEKKHRDTIGKLDDLRAELAKTKQENQLSMTKVQNLRDENMLQAETIAALKEQLRKCTDKPPKASIGTTCKSPCKDVGVDSYQIERKHVGIHNVPDTVNTSTIPEQESRSLQKYKAPVTYVSPQQKPPSLTLRTIACQSSPSEPQRKPKKAHFDQVTTINSYEEIYADNVYGVKTPPQSLKKETVEILEILQPHTFGAYGVDTDLSCDPFAFARRGYTTVGNELKVEKMLKKELLGHRSHNLSVISPADELEVRRPRRHRHPEENAEVLFNADNMCQSSNDSVMSDTDNITHKPLKAIDDGEISATYYSTKDDHPKMEEKEFVKTEVLQLEAAKKKTDGSSSRSASPSSNAESRSHSSKRSSSEEDSDRVHDGKGKHAHFSKNVATQGVSPTEDLQHVVQDLNESVSRIMEKTPNEKATREKIAQLEDQLRAALKQKEVDVEKERQKRNQEVENLKMTIGELDKALKNKQKNAINLQSACICGLKKEIKRLHVEVGLFKAEVENLQNYIKKCHQEIDTTKTILGKYLGQECSEYCIKQDESVVTLAQDTISYTEDLQCQLAVIQTALKREQKINMVQANRIEELQNIIGAKNIELSRINDAYQDVKSKMDCASSRNKMLENSIQELQEQLTDMEIDNLYQDEKTDICHGELDMCLNNLQSVKFKLRSQFKGMCLKVQENAQLQADLRIQTNNADIFKRDLENTRIRCRDELIEVKHNMRDLKEKLAASEDKIDDLNEQIKQSQALLVEASHREAKIKQDYLFREKQLTEKVHSAQEEEMRLLDIVTQLEQQIGSMKKDLDTRDAQIESAKKAMLQQKSDEIKKQQLSQEEVNKLKNEINSLVQQQGAQKVENERLQKQVECLKCCVHQNEAANKSVRQQLDKCLTDVKSIEADKFFLEQRNAKLMETVDKLQATLQTRTESIATMEIELLEAKTSRDEICNESRNVVCNVRAWLEEQKAINEQLKEKLQRKNALIMKYEQERSKKCQWECTCRGPTPRQRGGTSQHSYFQNKPIISRSPWSLDSRGSGSESPTSSVSSTHADWYEYEEVAYDAIVEESNPEMWIHRVESMTEELQRSNRYWKRKINDSEFMVTKDK